ncbi:MAG TPA: hypothetical protein VJ501_08455 [Burkholderiaceae bacterium]|nr:hypothetical protein [Burkholderiaceae bacterium]
MKTRVINVAATAALAAAGLAACAPDAWQNYKASGFNEYLNVVQTECQPLWIGDMYLTTFDASAVPSQPGRFDSLLDMTSKLYYNRSSPSDFRLAIQSLVLSPDDPRTNRSIDCMIAKLPADRPRTPGGPVR